MSLLTDNGGND